MHSYECRGSRTCSKDFMCIGEDMCHLCSIEEETDIGGIGGSCSGDTECTGSRTCSSEGICIGFSGCDPNDKAQARVFKQNYDEFT